MKTNVVEPSIITVNETYGFTVSEREYSLHKLVTVDPTKAPTYKAKPYEPVPQPYEKWSAVSRYYPVTPGGLRAMLLYVAQRSVGDNYTEGNVAGYIAAIQAELSRLRVLISSALIPTVPTAVTAE